MEVQDMVKEVEDSLRDMIDAGLVTRVTFYGQQTGTQSGEWKVVPWLNQKKARST
ncbi:hypothetical protein SAMN05880590_11014 [Rhizobium sp. RU35A]|uniref:hypothetical protein n=1 Tax=Rhizobium sp. RU35A TaxID=1907414 RepID=UPI00095434CC|nr:hypothetical protein [Rhizobium sp. RU35A]SIQ98977.1 hypothetical protein SAMN05880590_11014 [Rhizobium sp. RU35A]